MTKYTTITAHKYLSSVFSHSSTSKHTNMYNKKLTNTCRNSMGEEEEDDEKLEQDDSPRPMKLPYLPLPSSSSSAAAAAASIVQQYYHYPSSPEHEYYPSTSGTSSTPPLQTLASVPFKWEEQPGKPRPCTDIITLPEPKPAIKWTLDPPPCSRTTITKTPSPTSVLDVDGPYNVARPKFSSFRFFTEGKDQLQYSFDSGMMGSSPYKAATRRGLFSKFKSGRFRKDVVVVGGGGEVVGGSLRFSISPAASSSTASSSSCTDESCTRFSSSPAGKIRRNGSIANVEHHAKSTHFLASIYEGLKQVIQWRGGRKQKKQGKD